MPFTSQLKKFSLLTPNTLSLNSITTSPTIIYYGGPLRGLRIIESNYGFGLEFNSDGDVSDHMSDVPLHVW